jgi:hypothetical protein
MLKKHIKKCKILLSFVIMLMMAVPQGLTVAANTTVIIHYRRADGEYGNWNIWSWAAGTDGRVYHWTGETEFGVYAEVTVPHVTSSVGFIVRTDAWVKDVEPDRFIDIRLGNEIWAPFRSWC